MNPGAEHNRTGDGLFGQVACERRTVRCELHGQRLKWMTTPQTDWQERAFGPRERDDAFRAQAAMFLDAIEGRGTVACTLAEGWQTLRVNVAALASVRDGAWRTVPALAATSGFNPLRQSAFPCQSLAKHLTGRGGQG